jgi:hypothetical protein
MVTYDRKGKPSMLPKTDYIIFIVAMLIATLALIATYGFIKLSELKSMERNIESAIVKGIDPLAVRCAYGDNSWICMQYAGIHGKDSPNSSTISKK